MNNRKLVGLVGLFGISALSLNLPVAKASAAVPAANDDGEEGSVYVSTNETTGNAILVFNRAVDGTLHAAGSFPTGGLGSGGREPDFGLGNAGALALSDDRRFLLAVNPGSNDISVFAIRRDGLTLVDRQSSGGQQPLSITVHRNLVYVLNGGGNVGASDNISGFTFDLDGKLSHLKGSARPLSADFTAPAEIRFQPDGQILVVTEKATSIIDTFTVAQDGLATGPRVIPSDAQTPFGFDVKKNQLFVTDDFNDAPGSGALSSWLVANDGSIQLVSSIVKANETGACWVKISHDDRYAYVTDTVSGTEAQFRIDPDTARVTFVKAFPSPTGPTEVDLTPDGRFLYVLTPDEFTQGTPGINIFRVNPQDGSLTPVPGITNLPSTIDGLVVR